MFGAQAAILHGAARLTADVDVTVELGGRSIGELVDALRAAGFAPRVADIDTFAERSRVIPLVHEATTLPVDVVLAGPGLEQEFLEHAEERAIGDVRVPVASAGDLIVMKVLAGRPKDLDDVVAVLRANIDRIELGGVRATLRALEQALARADLLPAFDRALADAKRPA
ncbi:MAG: nucleotidyl transferase AbiEii/AbiGii toxin family protein [Candidatus Rokubacteria bacterium]|nr:nucleotidyl transferase AbiEii/AbiGii toxin family protein [Candidatus Rokubacteria bacterium]